MKLFSACWLFFTKICTWITNAVFPPRSTQILVANADFSSLERLLKVQTIPIGNLPQGHSQGATLRISVTALLPYRSPLVQAFILEAKFHNNKKAQEFLGKIIAEYAKTIPARSHLTAVPLPLGKKRRKERGYNQVEEIVKCSGLTFASDILARSRETTPQTTLGKEARLQNMSGAFSVLSPLNPGTTYVLLDDVVTTGATLLAANDALEKAGARGVILLALAH